MEILTNWNNKIKEVGITQDELNKIFANADGATQKYFQGLKGAPATLDGLAKATGKVSIGAKAASIAMGALKTAGNMAVAMLASLAINGIITLTTNACQSIDEKIKELNQELEQSVKKVKSISDEDFNKQFISEYRDIFLTIYEGMGSNSQIKKAVTLTATALKSLIHTLFQILAQLLKLIHKAALLLEILLVHLIFQL